MVKPLSPLERIAAFAEEVRDRAPEFEAQGYLSQDVANRLAEAEILRLCVPKSHGGPGYSPLVYAECVEALARSDGSTAWVAFIGITSSLAACKLEPKQTQEMMANPQTITAGVFAPMARARRCEQGGQPGYRLTGQWQWGSGSRNAAYISGGGLVVDKTGQVESLPNGQPHMRSFVMPIKDVTLLDTWHVSGLKGTGSTDFRVDDVFVPTYMTADPFEENTQAEPLLRFPFFAALGIGIGAVALGMAAASIEELKTLAVAKTPQGSGRSLAMKSATHRRVAQANATLKAARLYFYNSILAAWDEVQHSAEPSVHTRAEIRLATTHAVNSSVDVIDSMYTLAGGSSVYEKSALQRHFRDIHVATQHMMVNEATLELVGKVQLGLEANTSQL